MTNSLRQALETAFEEDEQVESEEVEEAVTSEDLGPAANEEELGVSDDIEDDDDEDGDRVGDPESEDSPPSDTKDSESGDSEYQEEVAAARAPESWRIAAREHWGDIPKEAQEEIMRREVETNEVLKQSAGAREIQGQLYRTVGPYMPMLNAQNATPVQAIQTAFKTMSALAIGNPTMKAQTIAGLIGSYGVDIKTLDGILAGKQPTAQARMENMIEQKLAPINQHISQQNQQVQQQQNAHQQSISAEIADFAAKNEFFNDVRQTMQHIMNMATDNGIQVTMEQAYNKACEIHPEVSKVIAGRNKQTGKADKRNLKRKKNAASSIKGNKRGDKKTPVENSLAADIAAAWDEVANV